MTTESPDITPAEDVETLSYEQARDQLAQVVASLEQGNASLEESLALWQRGNALANRCEHWLSGARKQLDEALNSQQTP